MCAWQIIRVTVEEAAAMKIEDTCLWDNVRIVVQNDADRTGIS
ncbi:MAG: hypothetical protein ACLUUO_12020 [Sellimonas intestinalis]